MSRQVILCPSCRAKVGIPGDRGRLKVRCPKCSTEWLYPPTVHYLDVAFRCARSGDPFTVTMKRFSQSEDFVIHRIGKSNSNISPKNRPNAVRYDEADKGVNFCDYDSDKFSWQGYYCPCCGYLEEYFVHCGRCDNLVCGCRVTKEDDGNKIFQCYPACGLKGRVTGSIENYGGQDRVFSDRPAFKTIANAGVAGRLTDSSRRS